LSMFDPLREFMGQNQKVEIKEEIKPEKTDFTNYPTMHRYAR